VQVTATPLTRGSHTLQQAASQKRQGTKSREVGQDPCRHGYGDSVASTAAKLGERDCAGDDFGLIRVRDQWSAL
jgi:hypothetical protein